MENFTPDQGFDPVPPMVLDEQSVYKHLEYYGLNKSQPIIYFITPTYKRTTQMVDLVRLSQALHMDVGIYWIVVEDSPNCTKRVRDVIDRVGLPYAHLAVPTNTEILQKGDMNHKPHRGVDQRNLALDWVETISEKLPGVVYFGDDDNAYDGKRRDCSANCQNWTCRNLVVVLVYLLFVVSSSSTSTITDNLKCSSSL
jgi:hypothetical protein